MATEPDTVHSNIRLQRQITLIIAAVLVCAVLGWLSFLIYDARANALKAAVSQADNLSSLLELRIRGLMREADLVLRDTADEVRDRPTRPLAVQPLKLQLKLETLPQASELAVFDEKAQLIRQVHGQAEQWAHLAMADWLNQFKLDRHQMLVKIDASDLLARSGTSMMLARALLDENGQYLGATVVVIPVARLLLLLGTLDVGKHGIVSLHDEQANWLARTPYLVTPQSILTPLPGLKDFVALKAPISNQRIESPFDGIMRITALRRVTDSPLILAVGLSESEVVQTLENSFLIYATASGILILLVSVMMMLFWQAQGRTQELLHSRRQLKLSEERFRLTAEVAPVSLVIASFPGMELEFINQRALTLFDTDKSLAQGKHMMNYFVEPEEAAQFDQQLRETRVVQDFEARLAKRDGSVFWALISASIEYDGDLKRLFICLVDITERKMLEMQLERQAITDSLTGLTNRRGFIAKAVMEISRSRRFNRSMSLMLLDIDHFKQVNDRYGHQVGDLALQSLASVCLKTLRQTDVIGRLGGEEFAVLLPETGQKLAMEVAERLRLEVAAMRIRLADEAPLWFTISIGVTILRDTHRTIDDVMAEADTALYQAKAAGRNRVIHCLVEA
ncbi:diguanylate cyclase [Chitinivorax sp. B]|uniref:diguanylate cyclase n=1 Tax=Chitinivorax sp. B TaxID=2502235 RepID=UPI0010F9C05B|nr:diguanylate cyclase [Chitinivorax sp. B]